MRAHHHDPTLDRTRWRPRPGDHRHDPPAPPDPDEIAVELARRRHDRIQRLAAAQVQRLQRNRHWTVDTEDQVAS